jgi:hypothetical protein
VNPISHEGLWGIQALVFGRDPVGGAGFPKPLLDAQTPFIRADEPQ